MAEYMNKELFLQSMGLTGDETKYGNRDAEHQHKSYSTYMAYEIMDSVEDSIVEEELAPVVKDLRPAVRLLHKEYERAKKNPVVRNPLAYALYQVWKAVDDAGMDGDGNG